MIIPKSSNRKYDSKVVYTRTLYCQGLWAISCAAYSGLVLEYHGGGPDKRIERRVVGAGHTSAQIGDYREQNTWYAKQTNMLNTISFGNHDGKTKITNTGAGWMGKAKITLRYVTQRNSGCTSVLSGQGFGPVSTLVDVCVDSGLLLSHKQHSRCGRVVFANCLVLSRSWAKRNCEWLCSVWNVL